MLKKIILILFLFSGVYYAQTVGASFMIGSPQGEFGDNVDRLGYGLQVHGTFWAPNKARPFTLGINLGYMVYGEETQRRPLSHTIPDVTVDVSRNNSKVNFHLLAQISPFTGDVRPYIEGLWGGSYLFTSTSVESEYDEADVFESTNFDDWAWSYGGGGGLLIAVGRDMGDVSRLFIDLKARYLFGSRAEYLKEGDVYVNMNNGDVTYLVSESKTSVLSFHLGVTAYFDLMKR